MERPMVNAVHFFLYLVAVPLTTAFAADIEPPSLTVGSVAPALDIENWIHDGNGAYQPVTKFKAGNVYVVEFWATWCGPCISAMPHIAETQIAYADKGVQVISISDEKLPVIDKFLQQTVRGQENQTYQQLTSVYCLTSDPDRSSHTDYMKAAGQNGIPTSFIVGKNGRIEWIGHPMSMDEPLASIVAGDWDREAFIQEFQETQNVKDAYTLARTGNIDAAIAALTAIQQQSTREKTQRIVTSYLGAIEQMRAERLILSRDQSAVAELEAYLQGKSHTELLPIALKLSSYKKINRPIQPEIVSLVMDQIAQSNQDHPEYVPLADTYARLLAQNGDFERAIAVQQAAIDQPSPYKVQLEATLAEIKRQQAAAETKQDKASE